MTSRTETPRFGAAHANSWRLDRGATMVDVGCGPGRAAAELAERGARAFGVDLDPAMLAAARDRFPDRDVRAAELPLGDREALGYRADKVLHVLPDPAAALAEARLPTHALLRHAGYPGNSRIMQICHQYDHAGE
ncbi:class I SAM-dependent methyltransferase [Dactylosporangium sp. NPDC049140]|uniref:class I SAM-dependent methyltransferase n=1 Tax=Dactylosporangium sp. NPDC049140 TaxID=3155647 RepID=UPI003404862D